jgi:hypothetical protein
MRINNVPGLAFLLTVLCSNTCVLMGEPTGVVVFRLWNTRGGGDPKTEWIISPIVIVTGSTLSGPPLWDDNEQYDPTKFPEARKFASTQYVKGRKYDLFQNGQKIGKVTVEELLHPGACTSAVNASVTVPSSLNLSAEELLVTTENSGISSRKREVIPESQEDSDPPNNTLRAADVIGQLDLDSDGTNEIISNGGGVFVVWKSQSGNWNKIYEEVGLEDCD